MRIVTVTIKYKLNGEIKQHRMSAHGELDDEMSLKLHMRRFFPDAEFISYSPKFDKKRVQQ